MGEEDPVNSITVVYHRTSHFADARRKRNAEGKTLISQAEPGKNPSFFTAYACAGWPDRN